MLRFRSQDHRISISLNGTIAGLNDEQAQERLEKMLRVIRDECYARVPGLQISYLVGVVDRIDGSKEWVVDTKLERNRIWRKEEGKEL